jgi:hypothetical protein
MKSHSSTTALGVTGAASVDKARFDCCTGRCAAVRDALVRDALERTVGARLCAPLRMATKKADQVMLLLFVVLLEVVY